MSSTKRNSVKRAEYDFYPTPEWCVHRFLEKAEIPQVTGALWLEPSAGEGAIVKAVGSFQYVHKNGVTTTISYKPTWRAIEIQSSFQETLTKELDQDKVIVEDFLKTSPTLFGVSPQVIITNPPFNQALEFVKKSMEYKPEYICMLLRLNFLGSQERSSFMRQHTPDIYVLPNRPSFSGKGTDSIEYAWFVWRKENKYGKLSHAKADKLENCPACHKPSKNSIPKLVILNDTSSEVRKRK